MITSLFPNSSIYASALFDTDVDTSFISHKFRSMVNHKSCKHNEAYTVEVGNDQIENTFEILTICLLILNNHVFHVNIIPVTI